ncbi:helix-turn-helix domain-containing protein [Nocardioides lianchengensis]|uniref:DNA binding domain-containing protein, excisionase family n=1 Tax=Nocardioides lianchengensis TaxID=1045774 RepID=A0A1G6JSA0_9ACTN|nr:helix-turn-helix domain-containing protein [Nocardioides lianchengensis]NYG08762.1 hypothetical protein [Nocardioides lianchengensis]SDC21622.1 hypothetical protein SAMN05421872_101567 [Nocardioides lianchengensis]
MSDDSDWLTWPQAAELVGCPVTTIETYVRGGRLVRRSGQGRHDGSLQRKSVEEFAVWWREKTEGLERRRQGREKRRIRPPESEGWIQATEAAERLGCAHSDHVVYLARQGRFEARKVGVRWWVRENEVQAYAAERDQWVSWLKAAEIVGCSHETIRRAVAAGKIERRDVHRTRASLSLESVLGFKGQFGSRRK